MHIFLSYPREYSGEADAISVRLRVAGHRLFFAPDELPAAGAYDDPIRRSILNSDLVIFLLGPEFFVAGRYTLTELEIARKKWPSPAGHVLPVLVRQMQIEHLPGYLRAISVLEPKGDAAAEIVAVVGELRKRSKKRFSLGLAATTVLLLLTLAVGTVLVKDYLKLRSRVASTLRGRESITGPTTKHVFRERAQGWGVSPLGVLHTEDGSVWDWQIRSKGLNSIVCVDRLSAWAFGYAGTILHTDNGGRTWERQASGEQYQNLYSASFSDKLSGWAVGSYGTILHTNDGGNTWTHQPSLTTANFTSVTFIGPQMGWVVGTEGTILNTRNAGQSWDRQHGPVKDDLLSVVFINAQIGWAVGAKGTILHTENAGRKWLSQRFGEHALVSVHFIDSKRGWIVGEGSTILHTEDGGNIWSAQSVEPHGSYDSVVFTTRQLGWISGNLGGVLRTEDGGVQWYFLKAAEGEQQEGSTPMRLISMTFVPPGPNIP